MAVFEAEFARLSSIITIILRLLNDIFAYYAHFGHFCTFKFPIIIMRLLCDYSSHVKLQILLIHRFQLIEHAFLVTSMDSKYRKHLKKKKRK